MNVTNFVAGDGVTFADEVPVFEIMLLEDAAEGVIDVTGDVVLDVALLLIGPVPELTVLLTDPTPELLLPLLPAVFVMVFVSV